MSYFYFHVKGATFRCYGVPHCTESIIPTLVTIHNYTPTPTYRHLPAVIGWWHSLIIIIWLSFLVDHRLNIKLDLQNFFGPPCAQLYSLTEPAIPPPPIPPHLGSYRRALLVSQDTVDGISLWLPVVVQLYRDLHLPFGGGHFFTSPSFRILP